MHLHWSIILGKNIFKRKRCFPTIKKFMRCLVSMDTWGNSPPSSPWRVNVAQLLFPCSFFFFPLLSFRLFSSIPIYENKKITKLKPGSVICQRKAACFISSGDFIFAHLFISWHLQEREGEFSFDQIVSVVHQTHKLKREMLPVFKESLDCV